MRLPDLGAAGGVQRDQVDVSTPQRRGGATVRFPRVTFTGLPSDSRIHWQGTQP